MKIVTKLKDYLANLNMGKDIRYWLYLSCFIDLFGVSFIVPVLGSHLRSLGFSNSLIGITSSVYAAVQLFSGPLVGSWSDTYGRKTVLYFTLFVCSLVYGFLGIATSFSVILCIRIVLGLIKHTQTICKTLVSDYIPDEKQMEIQGKLNGVASLGFMVGPVIGGHVAELENGFQYICFVTSAMFLVNGFIVFLSFPELKKSSKPKKGNTIYGISTIKFNVYRIVTDLYNVDWTNFWDIFSLKFILGISLSIFFSNYYLFVEETFNITPKYIGYTISFQGLVSAASGMQIEILNKFYKDNSMASSFLKVYHCFLILSISFLAIYLSSNIYMFLLFLLPLSSSTSLIRTITTELLLQRSDANHRGSLMGASNSVSSSTRMIAPLITGLVQDLFQASNIMVFASILSICGTYISFVIKTNNKEKLVKMK